MTNKEQIEFRKSVIKAKKLGVEMKNPSIDNAHILIDELLNHAIENQLPIAIAVSNDVNLNLYVQHFGKINEAKQHHSCPVSMYITNQGDYVENFILVGESSYRIETNKECQTAIGHFNNKLIGELLLNQILKHKDT